MWRKLYALVLTLVVLLVLIAGLAALPFIILFLILVGVGFIIYAVIHDRQIDREEKENDGDSRTGPRV